MKPREMKKKKKQNRENEKENQKKRKKKLRSLEVEHYLCCCAKSRASESKQSRERRSRCAESAAAAVQSASLCRRRSCAERALDWGELDWGRAWLRRAWLRQRRAWLLLAWGVPREWDESLSLKVRTEEWLSDFNLGLGLDFHFRTKEPKRRSVITWEVKKNKNPPTGQEPVQLLVFPVFRLNRPVFTVLPIFNIFSVFCHNRTGLEAGSQLNRSDRPVRSGF